MPHRVQLSIEFILLVVAACACFQRRGGWEGARDATFTFVPIVGIIAVIPIFVITVFSASVESWKDPWIPVRVFEGSNARCASALRGRSRLIDYEELLATVHIQHKTRASFTIT